MGNYISYSTVCQFLQSAKSLTSGKTSGILCSSKRITMRGLDLDGHSRRHRLLEQHGYMQAEEMGKDHLYTLTPKGLALYDYYKMKYPLKAL